MTPDHTDGSTVRRLLSPLRKRKLVQWTVAYAAGAWLLLQVVDIIGPRWGLTDGHSRTLDVVLIVGFAATLVLSAPGATPWIDLGVEGLRQIWARGLPRRLEET